jgi:hypothetical protein
MSKLFIIGLIGVSLIVMYVSVMVVRGQKLKKRLIQDTLASAISAQATVIRVEHGRFTSGAVIRKLEMKLTLNVAPPNGSSYEAQTKWVVEETSIPQIQPQQVIPVKINRNHSDRVYPDVVWAEFWDWTLDELRSKKY